ncbi:MAG: hypothetical protein ACK524_19365 [Planctomyces sp.]
MSAGPRAISSEACCFAVCELEVPDRRLMLKLYWRAILWTVSLLTPQARAMARMDHNV